MTGDALILFQHCSIEQIILHTMLLDIGQPQAVLTTELDPPSLESISSAILSLREVSKISVFMCILYFLILTSFETHV